MSKKFPTQDYFRYPRLGRSWRRPKGLQSKLRLKKGGSGMLVSIGYRTKAAERDEIAGMKYTLVSNASQLGSTGAKAVIISSGVGAKKSLEIAAKAKELDIRVLNMKKVRKSRKIEKRILAKKEKTSEKKKEKPAEAKKDDGKEKKKDAIKEKQKEESQEAEKKTDKENEVQKTGEK